MEAFIAEYIFNNDINNVIHVVILKNNNNKLN